MITETDIKRHIDKGPGAVYARSGGKTFRALFGKNSCSAKLTCCWGDVSHIRKDDRLFIGMTEYTVDNITTQYPAVTTIFLSTEIR